jgi:hypothetical protein
VQLGRDLIVVSVVDFVVAEKKEVAFSVLHVDSCGGKTICHFGMHVRKPRGAFSNDVNMVSL